LENDNLKENGQQNGSAKALQRMVRWLLPKEERFYDLLERQAVIADDGAAALAELRDGKASMVALRERLQELEHQGDAVVAELSDALARAFVTPIDREDLQKLSSELDDVIDLTTLAARSFVLFGVERPSEGMSRLLGTLATCTATLRRALPHLRGHAYEALLEAGRELRRLENEGDQIFRDALSRLFHDPDIDGKVLIREKELLEDLEAAIDHCYHVARTLAHVAVKHA
jgi:uncharacterized protein Yka (UPF0111/DUF47 family)